MNKYVECPDCHGTGELPCPCDNGEITDYYWWLPNPVEVVVHEACNGTGWNSCGACIGTGEILSHLQLI